jgi:hypothetical protein
MAQAFAAIWWGNASEGTWDRGPRVRRPARCAPPGPSRRSCAALLHDIKGYRPTGKPVERCQLRLDLPFDMLRVRGLL